jgi:triacylglycerol lipase
MLTATRHSCLFTPPIAKNSTKHGQKHTIILAHGLLGFDELRLAGHFFPGLKYWRGITEALSHNGIEVIVAAVPPSGSIEARAAKLAESIAQKAKGKQVNIIAYVKSRMRPVRNMTNT